MHRAALNVPAKRSATQPTGMGDAVAPLVSFYDGEPKAVVATTPAIHLEQFHVSRAHDFELGFAETGVAYVRHPVRPQRLLPLADYHPQVMIEKVNEAIGMLTALGASCIELAYTNSSSSEVRSEVELMFGFVNLGVKTSKGETHTVVYSASGAGSVARPLPPMLWLDQPGWRGIVDGRLNARHTKFAVSFTYEHRSGVNGELAIAVRKIGLRAGGDFRKAHQVSFSLKGDFPDDTRGFSRR
jgi:hypothetical protein